MEQVKKRSVAMVSMGPEKVEMAMRWSCPAGRWIYKSEVQGIS